MTRLPGVPLDATCSRCRNVYRRSPFSRSDTCRTCAAILTREQVKQMRAQRRRDGLCRVCGESVEGSGSTTYCTPHFEAVQERNRRSNARRTAKRRRERVCAWCGGGMQNAAHRRRKYCGAVCAAFGKRETDNAWARDLQARGLCVGCSKERGPNGTRWNCETCKQDLNRRLRERSERLRQQGVCTACGDRPALDGIDRCHPCSGRVSKESA